MTNIPTDFPLITQAWFGIWYRPFGAELDPASLPFVRERGLLPGFVLPRSADADPALVLRNIVAERAYLLIPGTKFDESGTRHGRGGGWYDRFLAMAPNSWVRLGVVGPGQWSDTKLVRQAWDQPMDGFVFPDETMVRWSLVPRRSR